MPTDTALPLPIAARFELYFESLFNAGRGLAFPCDGLGQVNIDGMSSPARTNCRYARGVIGREYRCPAVRML